VLDLARAFSPHVWLNIHSGMEAMFVPWDHQSKVSALDQLHARLRCLEANLVALDLPLDLSQVLLFGWPS